MAMKAATQLHKQGTVAKPSFPPSFSNPPLFKITSPGRVPGIFKSQET